MTTKQMSRSIGMQSFGWNKTGCFLAKYIERVYCVQATAEVHCGLFDHYNYSIHLKNIRFQIFEESLLGTVLTYITSQ